MKCVSKYIATIGLLLLSAMAIAFPQNVWQVTGRVIAGSPATIYALSDPAGNNGFTIICATRIPSMMVATVNGRNFGPGQPEDFELITNNQIYRPAFSGSYQGSRDFREAWKAIAWGKQVFIRTSAGTVRLPTEEAIKVLFPDVTKTKCVTQ